MAQLAINMVATVDGRAAVHGTATGIGSERDRVLMKELRAQADVVLHGAGTVRADPLSARVPPQLAAQRAARGLSQQPVGAIVTSSGNLPVPHPYYESATLIYITSEKPVTAKGATIEVVRVADVAAVVADLDQRGLKRILCEGGPRLNAALFDAGLVNELYFTVAPKLVGGFEPLTLIHGGSFAPIKLTLLSLDEHEGELFLHYAVEGPTR